MEPEGGTCATRVTRGTFDFQARFSLRMVMGGVVFSGTLPSFGTRRCALVAERSKQLSRRLDGARSATRR